MKFGIYRTQGEWYAQVETAHRAKEFGPFDTWNEAEEAMTILVQSGQPFTKTPVDLKHTVPSLRVDELRPRTDRRGHEVAPLGAKPSAQEVIKTRLLSIVSGRHIHGNIKTQCKRGHSLLDPANIYITAAGYPVCRTCRRDERQKARHAEKIFVDNSPEIG